MSVFVVDVEADGPCPGLYSMVSFGAVKVSKNLDQTFYGKVAPISSNFIPEALAVSGHSRQEHESFLAPSEVMKDFMDWVTLHNTDGRPIFVSDNPAFDWQFINYYFHAYCKLNPFGHSARRFGDFYAGLEKNWKASSYWKSLRKTKHTHNPVDDAKGVAEALVHVAEKFRLKGILS